MAENWEEMREKIGKNWFRMSSGKEWADLCVIAIGSLEVIGICHMSYQLDECGTRPFLAGP